jgi:hypothetical protein
VTFPVAGVEGSTWEALRARLALLWRDCTALSNWAMTELYKREPVRVPADDALPLAPRSCLYPEARALFVELPPRAVATVLNSVGSKYRKCRHDVVWKRAASLPSFRYPVPCPFHNQSWQPRRGKGGEPLVELPFATLRLGGGKPYRRQLRAFDAIAAGDAVRGELSIYRKAAGGANRRTAVVERTPGGGARRAHRVMVRMVAWFPRAIRVSGQSTVRLSTGRDSLLRAEVDAGEPWVFHADHVRRFAAEHRERMRRLAGDRRAVAASPRGDSRSQAFVDKQRRRMKTAIEQAVSGVVRYALRRGAARIVYDDSERSFAALPWHLLREQLAAKADELGLELVLRGDAPPA